MEYWLVLAASIYYCQFWLLKSHLIHLFHLYMVSSFWMSLYHCLRVNIHLFCTSWLILLDQHQLHLHFVLYPNWVLTQMMLFTDHVQSSLWWILSMDPTLENTSVGFNFLLRTSSSSYINHQVFFSSLNFCFLKFSFSKCWCWLPVWSFWQQWLSYSGSVLASCFVSDLKHATLCLKNCHLIF